MLSYKYAECRKKPVMLSVIVLSVVMLSVVAPNQALAKEECITKNTTDNGTTCFLEVSIVVNAPYLAWRSQLV